MQATRDLSDNALAVFAFAAYQQLATGQRVASIVQQDGAGHRADDAAVNELQRHGLAEADGTRIQFTEAGERLLQTMIDSLRESAEAT